jgi:hypothetical protein
MAKKEIKKQKRWRKLNKDGRRREGKNEEIKDVRFKKKDRKI